MGITLNGLTLYLYLELATVATPSLTLTPKSSGHSGVHLPASRGPMLQFFCALGRTITS